MSHGNIHSTCLGRVVELNSVSFRSYSASSRAPTHTRADQTAALIEEIFIEMNNSVACLIKVEPDQRANERAVPGHLFNYHLASEKRTVVAAAAGFV